MGLCSKQIQNPLIMQMEEGLKIFVNQQAIYQGTLLQLWQESVLKFSKSRCIQYLTQDGKSIISLNYSQVNAKAKNIANGIISLKLACKYQNKQYIAVSCLNSPLGWLVYIAAIKASISILFIDLNCSTKELDQCLSNFNCTTLFCEAKQAYRKVSFIKKIIVYDSDRLSFTQRANIKQANIYIYDFPTLLFQAKKAQQYLQQLPTQSNTSILINNYLISQLNIKQSFTSFYKLKQYHKVLFGLPINQPVQHILFWNSFKAGATVFIGKNMKQWFQNSSININVFIGGQALLYSLYQLYKRQSKIKNICRKRIFYALQLIPPALNDVVLPHCNIIQLKSIYGFWAPLFVIKTLENSCIIKSLCTCVVASFEQDQQQVVIVIQGKAIQQKEKRQGKLKQTGKNLRLVSQFKIVNKTRMQLRQLVDNPFVYMKDQQILLCYQGFKFYFLMKQNNYIQKQLKTKVKSYQIISDDQALQASPLGYFNIDLLESRKIDQINKQ